MRYFLALALIALMPLLALGQQTTASRLIAYNLDGWDGGWTRFDTIHYTYSGNRGGDLMLEGVEPVYDTKTDFDYELIESTYDAGNNKTMSMRKVWINSAWLNDVRHTYTYDANNNLIELLIGTWDGNGQWSVIDRIVYTYGTNNEILTAHRQWYSNSAWSNTSLKEYQYDSHGNLTSLTWSSLRGSVWQYSLRDIYTYNANNQVTMHVHENYDQAGVLFMGNRYTSSYANGYKTSYINEVYNGSGWQISEKNEYINDANGNVIEEVLYRWVSGAWTPRERYLYTYTNDIVTGKLTSTWSVGGSWIDIRESIYTLNAHNQYLTHLDQRVVGPSTADKRHTYYYEEYNDASGITAIPTLSSAVLPNPFTINVAIQLTVAEAGNHSFEVFNMAGQRIHSENRSLAPGQQTIVWEGQDVPKGVYFYKINSASGVASGKLVKQ